MSVKMIVSEYLNHFFTYEELADYLDVYLEDIETVLDNPSVIASELGKKYASKVEHHRELVKKWLSADKSKQNLVYAEEDKNLVTAAFEIINGNLSIRKAALKVGMSKSYLHDQIEETLPKISITLYKQVFDVLKKNKSLSLSESKVRLETTLYAYDLSKQGKSIKEISEIMSSSHNSVQRDLSNRLMAVDQDLGEEAKSILGEHKRKLITREKNKRS